MSGQLAYRKLEQTLTLPLFVRSWWLDVTAGKSNWDAVIVKSKEGELLGVWAFAIKKQIGFLRITQPAFTPYMGPVLFYPENISEYEKRSFENKVIKDLISQLPENNDIQFKWDWRYDNWLPFYWEGFDQNSRYTYLLDTSLGENQLWLGLKESLRRQIKKAENKGIQCKETNNAHAIIDIFKQSMDAKDLEKLADKTLLLQLNDAVVERKCGHILEAQINNEVVAAIYLVKDQEQMYYLYGAYKKEYSDSGAMSLLFWKGIQMSAQQGLKFNFEGSMLEGVERFFRSFGAKLTSVSFISKRKFPFSI